MRKTTVALLTAAIAFASYAALAQAHAVSYAPTWRDARHAIDHVAAGDHVGVCTRDREWLTCQASYVVMARIGNGPWQHAGTVRYLIKAAWRDYDITAWSVFSGTSTLTVTSGRVKATA